MALAVGWGCSGPPGAAAPRPWLMRARALSLSCTALVVRVSSSRVSTHKSTARLQATCLSPLAPLARSSTTTLRPSGRSSSKALKLRQTCPKWCIQTSQSRLVFVVLTCFLAPCCAGWLSLSLSLSPLPCPSPTSALALP